MKKIFSLVVLFASVLMANAQSSMLATLNHEGTISTFYGATALREAHAAAAHGDVITLSSGSFTSVDITKAITLRGAGMEIDTVARIDPTVIRGGFTILIADSITQRLTIEGIYSNYTITNKSTLSNPMFLKSRFTHIVNEASMKNANFIHCKIVGQINLPANSSASCINCVIEDPVTNNTTTSNFEFLNCVIQMAENNACNLFSSVFKNCYIYVDYSNAYIGYYKLDGSCAAYNCIGSGQRHPSYIFANVKNSNNRIVATAFKTFKGGAIPDSEDFELTVEAQKEYLGMDGTQIGIHGGMLPFSSTPSNPQITKCNVAAKSTADGKLSVDIEVKAAE